MQAWNSMFGLSHLDGVVSPDYAVFEILPRSDSRFLTYQLRSHFYAGQFLWRSRGMGTAFLRLHPENLLDTPFADPPLPVQRHIADFLDAETTRIDALMEKKRRIMELLHAREAAVIDAALHATGAPEKRLKHLLARPLQYGANEAAEYDDPAWPRYIRITDVDDQGRLREETFRSLPPDVARPYLLDDGDLLLTRSGATVGKSFEYRSEWGAACYAGYLIRASLDRTRATPRYVSYFLRSTSYWSQIAETTLQATIQNVNAERYGDLRLPVPGLDVQEDVAIALDIVTTRHRSTRARIASQIDLLLERRSALVTAAVTGQLDVAEAA
jgi:restriction endonuclease S subunit